MPNARIRGPKTIEATASAARGSQEDRARRHVLRPLDPGMPLGGRHVAERLEGGVEPLRGPDCTDRQRDGEPLAALDSETEPGGDDEDRRDGVDPRVRLAHEHREDAACGEPEGVQSTPGREGAGHGSIVSVDSSAESIGASIGASSGTS